MPSDEDLKGSYIMEYRTSIKKIQQFMCIMWRIVTFTISLVGICGTFFPYYYG